MQSSESVRLCEFKNKFGDIMADLENKITVDEHLYYGRKRQMGTETHDAENVRS